MDPDPRNQPAVRVGSRAEAWDLEATIRTAQEPFRVGQRPWFHVRILNRAARRVLLVAEADGSDSGGSPHVSITIDGPDGGFRNGPHTRCGYRNGVYPSHFIEIMPGEEFDPYQTQHEPRGLRLPPSFMIAGSYRATFRYRTTENDPTSWLPQPSEEWRSPHAWRDLLECVPAVDLVATVSFDVQP